MDHASGPKTDLKNLGALGVLIGAVGIVACIFGYVSGRESFLQSWMFGWIFWVAVTLGCLGFRLLHYAIRGQWSLSTLRIWEAGSSPVSLLVMAIAGLPILANLGTFYPHWVHPNPEDHVIMNKASYLNPAMFSLRFAICFVVWIVVSGFLRNLSIRDDAEKNWSLTAKRINWASGFIPFFVVLVTVAITDWVMSLDPHWFSQIFGFWYVVTGGVCALAIGTIVVCANRDKYPYKDIWSASLGKDLGNMLFTFTLLWAYFALSQWIITWSGNLPEFIKFYVDRREGWLNILGGVNIFLGFFAPFMFLLAPRTKARADLLLPVAVLILVMHISDVYYNVIPMFRTNLTLWDFVAFVTVGALWTAIMARQTKAADLYPQHDMRLMEAAHAHV